MVKNINESNKKLNILVLEGFILLVVILLHTTAPKPLIIFFSYGIPILFFIRGYQWRDRTLQEIFSGRIQLIKTYYTAGIIGTILFVLFSPNEFVNYKPIQYFLNMIIANVKKGDEIAIIIAPIWFLMTLFITDIFYTIIRKNKVIGSTILVLCILLRLFKLPPLPFRITTVIYGLPYVELGRIWKSKNLKVNFYQLILAISTLLAISYFNGEISWYIHSFNNVLLTLIGEFSAIIISVWIGIALTSSIFKEFLQKVALNALFIFGYHGIIGVLIAFIYIPILKFFQSIDLLTFVSKIWFLHYILTVTIIMYLTQILPKNVKYFLTGNFRFFKNRSKGVN